MRKFVIRTDVGFRTMFVPSEIKPEDIPEYIKITTEKYYKKYNNRPTHGG